MEPLILYFVLFFPGIYASSFSGALTQVQSIPFSILRELGRTLTYTVPSLVLLWYLIPKRKGFSALRMKARPRKRDLFPFGISLAGLIIIGLFVSLLATIFFKTPSLPKIESPSSLSGWIVIVFSCLCTGYLEESYFRYYLLSKLDNVVPNEAVRICFSTVLFSICHIYEGPWGIANALLAGILLSVIFLRYRSLHGIAWAHGAYNLFVYVMSVW